MTDTATTLKPNAAEMATFDQWLDFYTARFAGMRADALKGYWWLYGRDSEESAPPREMAAWAAVNAEMQARGL
jgi:hypothetical protein